VRDWAHGFIAILAMAIGALLYYFVLYTSRLIPRWLSGWGLVGAALLMVSTVMAGLAQDFGFTTVNTVLNIPIALQELVLAVWLIAKGFDQSALRERQVGSPAPTGPSRSTVESEEPHRALRPS
jgi:hypothetical protein